MSKSPDSPANEGHETPAVNEADIDTAEVLVQRASRAAAAAPLPSWLQEGDEGEPVDTWHSMPIPVQSRTGVNGESGSPVYRGGSRRTFDDLVSVTSEANHDVAPVAFRPDAAPGSAEHAAEHATEHATEHAAGPPAEFTEAAGHAAESNVDTADLHVVRQAETGNQPNEAREPVVASEPDIAREPNIAREPAVASESESAPSTTAHVPPRKVTSSPLGHMQPDLRDVHPGVHISGPTPTPSQGISIQPRSNPGVSSILPSALRRGSPGAPPMGGAANDTGHLRSHAAPATQAPATEVTGKEVPAQLSAAGNARTTESRRSVTSNTAATRGSARTADSATPETSAGRGVAQQASGAAAASAKIVSDSMSRGRGWVERLSWKVWTTIAIVVALLVVALVVIFGTKVLAVNQVSVAGNSRVSADAIKAATQKFVGVPLARVGITDAALAAAGVNGVESATATRQWPNTLKITIVERVPIAVYKASNGLIVVDKTGYSMAEVKAPPEGLPTLAIEPFDGLLMVQTLAVYQQLPDSVRKDVIDMGATGRDGMYFQLSEGRKVIWGSIDKSEAKGAVIETVLNQKGMSVYDISAPESVVTRK